MTNDVQKALNVTKNSVTEITNLEALMKMEMETRALKTAYSILNQTNSGDDPAFCELPWRLEELEWTDELSMGKEKLTTLAGDLVSAYVSNPGMSCVERILKRFLLYAKTKDMGEHVETIDIIADEESLAKEEDLRRCGKPIKCLKKLRRVCSTKDFVNWQNVDEDSKSEICQMYLMKKYANDHFMALGMKDLYNKVMEDDYMHDHSK